jgi:hypothetical protein
VCDDETNKEVLHHARSWPADTPRCACVCLALRCGVTCAGTRCLHSGALRCAAPDIRLHASARARAPPPAVERTCTPCPPWAPGPPPRMGMHIAGVHAGAPASTQRSRTQRAHTTQAGSRGSGTPWPR